MALVVQELIDILRKNVRKDVKQGGDVMRKTIKASDTSHKLAVSAETLASMLDCGRATAVEIGTNAQARIQVGRRVLWNINKIQKYLDEVSTQ